ncbi:MAG: hypothetical protein OK457_04635 [Thaumarchaeota archaeon]|nr:hypothetical protein [Nitrososphaerota archaeon]
MPARLFAVRRNKIISRYLEGYGRNEIERMIGSRGSVTREIDRFGALFEDKGWQAAGDEYQVSEKLEKLVEVAGVSRRNKVDLEEMVAGAEVAAELKRNQIDNPRETKKFIGSVLKLGKEKDYDAQKLISSCEKQNQLTELYGDFEDVKGDWESTGKKLPGAKEELIGLQNSIKTRKKELENLDGVYDVRASNFKSYVTSRDFLKALGLDIDLRLDQTVNILQNVAQHHADPKVVVDSLKQFDDLKSRISTLEGELKDGRGDLETLQRKIVDADSEQIAKQATLDSLQVIENTGLDATGMQKITDTVVKISAAHGLNRREALDKFNKDLLENYDASLGLEPEIRKLNAQRGELLGELEKLRSQMKKVVSDAQQELDAINGERQKKQEELGAYTNLRTKGVTDATLLGLSLLIEEASIDDIWQTIKGISDLNKILDRKREEVRVIEETKETTLAALTTAREQKGKIEAAIEELRKTALDEIKKITSNAKTSATEFSDNLTELIKTATPAVSTLKHAFEVLEEVGKLETMMVIWDLYSEGKGEDAKVLPIVGEILTRFKNFSADKRWAQDASVPLESLISVLNTEVNRVG